MPHRILLVDDHKVVREGLKAILIREGEFVVVGEAESGVEAVRLSRSTDPELVLMDISLHGMNGIEATTEIVRQCPGVKVVILSMHQDEDLVVTAIRAGARGFVLKRASSQEVLEALRTVSRGGTYLGSDISEVLLMRLQRGDTSLQARSPVDALSPREMQVLRLIAEGKGSKEAAEALGLEHNTVRSYRKTLMKKLGVNNLASLIQMAMAAGIIKTNKNGADL